MQKLAYLYGWQTFFEECDDVDDETLYEMAVLLGVMMGVGSANSMLTVIAKNAQEAVAKKVARQSLTKTSWYPILKKLLSFMGIKITKQTVGDAAGKVVVGVGGVISSGMVEDANVELTQELVQMIIQQRNYQANAQSIKAQDQILQTLVNLR